MRLAPCHSQSQPAASSTSLALGAGRRDRGREASASGGGDWGSLREHVRHRPRRQTPPPAFPYSRLSRAHLRLRLLCAAFASCFGSSQTMLARGARPSPSPSASQVSNSAVLNRVITYFPCTAVPTTKHVGRCPYLFAVIFMSRDWIFG